MNKQTHTHRHKQYTPQRALDWLQLIFRYIYLYDSQIIVRITSKHTLQTKTSITLLPNISSKMVILSISITSTIYIAKQYTICTEIDISKQIAFKSSLRRVFARRSIFHSSTNYFHIKKQKQNLCSIPHQSQPPCDYDLIIRHATLARMKTQVY